MKTLYRSTSDKQLTGICGGIAAWLGIDSTVVRLIAVVGALVSFGTVIALYLIASVIVPKEPVGHYKYNDYFTNY
ncbi:DNA-binding transcriptional activator PspC [compost metagenome]